MRTVSFDEGDHTLHEYGEAEVERLLWNLEVLREQLGSLDIVAGPELSDDASVPGLGVRAPGYDPRHIAATANALQREGRMERGAVYIYDACVYIDNRGTPTRGYGDAEDASPMQVDLQPGLDIRTIYQGDALQIDHEFTRPVRGELPSDRPSDRVRPAEESALALPSGPLVKAGLVVGVGALMLGGAWYAMRTLRRAATPKPSG